MTKEEVQPGALVSIPKPRNENDAESYARAVFYLDALLANHAYPYDYLVVGEPYSSDDNVRLYMAPPFPQFPVESFHLSDLVCSQPAPALTKPAVDAETLTLSPADAKALGEALLAPAPAPNKKLIAAMKRATPNPHS